MNIKLVCAEFRKKCYIWVHKYYLSSLGEKIGEKTLVLMEYEKELLVKLKK